MVVRDIPKWRDAFVSEVLVTYRSTSSFLTNVWLLYTALLVPVVSDAAGIECLIFHKNQYSAQSNLMKPAWMSALVEVLLDDDDAGLFLLIVNCCVSSVSTPDKSFNCSSFLVSLSESLSRPITP